MSAEENKQFVLQYLDAFSGKPKPISPAKEAKLMVSHLDKQLVPITASVDATLKTAQSAVKEAEGAIQQYAVSSVRIPPRCMTCPKH